MSHQIQNFDLHLKADRRLEVTVLDSTGGVILINGSKISWHFANEVYDTAPLFTKRSTGFASGGSSEIQFINSTAGRFDILLDKDDIPRDGVFYHQGRVIDSFGNETFIFSGHVTVEPSLRST